MLRLLGVQVRTSVDERPCWKERAMRDAGVDDGEGTTPTTSVGKGALAPLTPSPSPPPLTADC